MATAVRARHLGADHPVARVRLLVDRIVARRGVERGPAAAGVVLRLGGEQLRAAAGAAVRAVLEDGVVLAAERPFGALLAQDAVLLGAQLGPPLGFGLLDLGHASPSRDFQATVSRPGRSLRATARRPRARPSATLDGAGPRVAARPATYTGPLARARRRPSRPRRVPEHVQERCVVRDERTLWL